MTTAALAKSDQVTLILIIVSGFRVNPKMHLQSEHENALSFSLRKQLFEVGLEVSTVVIVKIEVNSQQKLLKLNVF